MAETDSFLCNAWMGHVCSCWAKSADVHIIKDILQEYPEKARKTGKVGGNYKEILMNSIRKDKMDETAEAR